ncbi:MAG: hypothetical protein HFE85_02800 [Clostridiales bacterium]|nr:hypothetical protein [Clostridiales bacterium]
MKQSKKWSLTILIAVLITLLGCAGATVIADPLLQYHKPLPFYTSFYREEAYINPGIVKTTSFDTLLLGASTTQNTDMEYFRRKISPNSIKLIYSGPTTLNYKTILNLAFEKQDLKAVYYALDLSTLQKPYDTTPVELPEYLYDDDLTNDINYLLNKDIFLKEVLQNTVNSLRGKHSDPVEDTETWLEDAKFGRESVMKNLHVRERMEQSADVDLYLELAKGNLTQNILPFLEEHPDVQFTFFVPPNCISYWYGRKMDGTVDASFQMLEYVTKTLLEYDNVELYYFQDQFNWITDFDNYIDNVHFRPELNVAMVDCIAAGEHRLTKENYRQVLQSVKSFVDSYDYKAMLEGK